MANYQDTRVKLYQQAGQAVGDMLRNRWQTKQAEDWMENEFQAFQDATAEFNNNLANIEDGDEMAKASMQWNQNVLMPFMTRTASKYSDNETIMNVMQGVDAAHRRGLQDFISMKELGVKEETGEAQAEAARAQAGQARAATARTYANIPGETALRQAQTEEARAGTALSEARLAEVEETKGKTAEIAGIIQRNIQGGALHENGLPWGQDPASDELAATRMYWAARGNPPTPTETRTSLLSPRATDAQLLSSVLIGDPTQIGESIDLTDVGEAIEDIRKLPETDEGLQATGDTFYSLINSVRPVTGREGAAIVQVGEKPVVVTSEQALRAAYKKLFEDQVIKTTSGSGLIQGKTRNIGNAVIDRFASMKARELGLKGARAAKPEESTAVKLLRSAAEWLPEEWTTGLLD